jgi:hypothetical protein
MVRDLAALNADGPAPPIVCDQWRDPCDSHTQPEPPLVHLRRFDRRYRQYAARVEFSGTTVEIVPAARVKNQFRARLQLVTIVPDQRHVHPARPISTKSSYHRAPRPVFAD